MTERKPLGVTFESWIDKQVREATERGEFENLRGAGKPIPNSVDDENWWLTNYLRREGVRGDGLLPPSLILRRDIEELPETVRDMTSEREVRIAVSELNERIVDWLRMPHGPYIPVRPVNGEEIIAQWRADRAAARRAAQPIASEPSTRPALGRTPLVAPDHPSNYGLTRAIYLQCNVFHCPSRRSRILLKPEIAM